MAESHVVQLFYVLLGLFEMLHLMGINRWEYNQKQQKTVLLIGGILPDPVRIRIYGSDHFDDQPAFLNPIFMRIQGTGVGSFSKSNLSE